MSDLTDFSVAAHLTKLVRDQPWRTKPDPVAEVGVLRIELRDAHNRIEELESDLTSLTSLIGTLVHFHLDDAVELTREQLERHPNYGYGLTSTAHTIEGSLHLRTV